MQITASLQKGYSTGFYSLWAFDHRNSRRYHIS